MRLALGPCMAWLVTKGPGYQVALSSALGFGLSGRGVAVLSFSPQTASLSSAPSPR